ncbi:MAG: metal ABC transporter permease [Clostridia bacterium]
MFEAILKYQFLQNAIFASLLASIVCGIVGALVIEKKLIMMSGGIAHTAYGGVGLGYLLGFEPIIGAVIFSVISAVGVGLLKNKKGGSDIVIALLWSLGMALGILFIGLMKGYPPDMNSYLFGDILTVTRLDIYFMLALTIVVCIVVFIFFQSWKSFLFDQEYAKINGLPVTLMEYALLILIALTIVVLIRVAGIILMLALLTAPAATAGLLSNKLGSRMLIASILGICFCLVGLTVSYFVNIASGAIIVILSVVVYGVTLAITSLIKGKKKSKV